MLQLDLPKEISLRPKFDENLEVITNGEVAYVRYLAHSAHWWMHIQSMINDGIKATARVMYSRVDLMLHNGDITMTLGPRARTRW